MQVKYYNSVNNQWEGASPLPPEEIYIGDTPPAQGINAKLWLDTSVTGLLPASYAVADNCEQTVAGQAVLDAHQGYLLQNQINNTAFSNGNLLAFGRAYCAGNGSQQTSNTNYGFSSSSVGSSKSNSIVNYYSSILTFESGTFKVSTKGIVGMIKATISISGIGTSSSLGLWFQPQNNSSLPTGVTIPDSSQAGLLVSDPVGARYGGGDYTLIYVVNTNDDVSFFIDPIYRPYQGAFTPGAGSVGCSLTVEVYAKNIIDV